jgi:[ribosomal protein S18]-alanine N-acetyltransferase
MEQSLINAYSMAHLHRLCFSKPWSVTDFGHFLQSEHHLVKFQASDIGMEALIILQIIDNEAEIITFCTAPSLRRQGIGLGLLQRALDDLKVRCVSKVFLEVDFMNEAALRLYQTLGFAVVGIRKDYYDTDNGAHDANVLSLMI